MPISKSERERQRRQALRDAGLRPIEIWVPDTGKPGFTEECRRQARIAAASDAEDEDLQTFMKEALVDLLAIDE